jgi:lipopolysaccharide transport protein LptA
MLKGKKILFIFFGYLSSTILTAMEEDNFQNISIQSDLVTIDEKERHLTFKNNIKIIIENYMIEGSTALLTQEDEKLEIYGNPTSIQSSGMDGEAQVLVIYPNKSIDLIGNAKLKKNGNLITSNLIKYQIN